MTRPTASINANVNAVFMTSLSLSLSSLLSLSLSLSLLLLLLTSQHLLEPVQAGGAFQSGPNSGALYAGGLDYADTKNLYITGVTYDTNGNVPTQESSCFVSKLESQYLQHHSAAISSRLGDGDVMEACHAISLLHNPLIPTSLSSDSDNNYKPFVIAGTSDPGGIYGSAQDTPSGFVMALNPRKGADFAVEAGLSVDDAGQTNTVSYPVSILYEYGIDIQKELLDVINNNDDDDADIDFLDILDGMDADGRDGNYGVAYVASLSSTDLNIASNNKEVMEKAEADGQPNQPNWLKYRKYGSSFEMTLQKFRTTPGDGGVGTKIEEDWTETYPVDVDPRTNIKPDVYLAGMILKKEELLIVAGSTRGSGTGYGAVEPNTDDEDGFISIINAETGTLFGGYNSNVRIGTEEIDLILGICDDPKDRNAFYIVGTTGDGPGMGERIENFQTVLVTNEGSLHGFVQKIQLDTLERIWGVRWGANHMGDGIDGDKGKATITAGIGCKALEDGTLYITGIVEDGAHVIRSGHEGAERNGDDIVTARLDSETGEVKWIKQFGSKDGSENLARSGGVAVDAEQNLIVYGDTTGSLFRARDDDSDDGTSDIFLATLSKADGSHNIIGSVVANVPTIAPVKAPTHDWEKEMPAFADKFNKNDIEDDIYGTGDWFRKEGLGIQSGPSLGSLFAGGMVYNADEDTVYLAGIAYDDSANDDGNSQSSCMITKLPMEGMTIKDWSTSTGKIIGSNNILEVCNSVALHGYSEVVAVGSADNGSPILDSKNVAEYPMAGFALALDRNNLDEIDATPVVTTTPNNKIQYPIDVVSDGDDLYIVSLTSTDNKTTREFNQLMKSGGSSDFSPNWINMEKYGTSLDMTVTKVTLKEESIDGVAMGDISFTTQWSTEFPVTPDADGGAKARVFLGGAIVKKSRGYLAVAGSTRGMGMGYGAAQGNDEDGFITLLDLDTGELSLDVVRNSIREGTSKDDLVLGICHDPADDKAFYIVGATEGSIGVEAGSASPPEGSFQAFLRKIDANNLGEIYTVEFGAVRTLNNEDDEPTVAKAFDCAVSGDTVFVGGVVDDNARMVLDKIPRITSGGDDIWMSSVVAKTGVINWLRQAGSPGNDHIAPRGGLAISKSGDVLVFGDTNGEFYRVRSDSTKSTTSDLFLVEFHKDGSYQPHIRHNKRLHPPSSAPMPSESVPVPPAPTSTTQGTPTVQGTPTTQNTPVQLAPTVQASPIQLAPVAPPKPTNNNSNVNSAKEPNSGGSGGNKNGISTGALVGILIVVVLVLIVLAYFVLQRLGFSLRSTKKIVDYNNNNNNNSKIQVRDGLITSSDRNNSTYTDAPPPSSFAQGGKGGMLFGDDPLGGYSENLKDNGKHII